MANLMSIHQTLDDLARAKWRSSGLSDEHAQKLNLKPVTGEEMASLAPGLKRLGGVVIPYFAPDGKVSEFFRVRYLEQPTGFAAAVKKQLRYEQPAGTLVDAYLPPLLPFTWEVIFADPKLEITITEGEFKAASACSVGIATLGLGGVDSWRAKKRGIDFLPNLAKIVWQGRRVNITFDSDAASNENVVRAQLALSRELSARGALPRIVSLPSADDGTKLGLDDYLVRYGREPYDRVVESAEFLPEAQALWEMNGEVVYIKDPGLVVVRDTNQKLKPSDFTGHAYANHHFMRQLDSGKMKKEQTAHEWMRWEQRFELKKITYSPGQGQVTEGGMWNEWRGWGCDSIPGDVGPWHRLLDYVFRGDKEARLWFERWCAYPLQHPGTKLFTSVVLWSVHQGTGKTLLAYTLRDIYGDNAIEIKDKHLAAGFNTWARNRQFIIGDEVTSRSDKRDEADHLKGLITNEFVRVNEKFIPEYTIPDVMNYFFTSNNPDAFFMEDSDRRYFVWEIISKPESLLFYRMYDKWLKSTGPSHLFHYLLNLDLGDFNPKGPAPATGAKKAMIVDNKSDLGLWVHQLKEDPTAALSQLGSAAASHDCDLFSTEQLHHAYDPEQRSKVTVNGLGRELKRADFRQVNDGQPVRTVAKLMRLYAVRNVDKWMSAEPSEFSAHWNKFFSGGKY
jgi:hypothetical protein